MGRKKATPRPEATGGQANGKAVTLAGAASTALSARGAEAETPAVKQRDAASYPTGDISAPSFQSALSIKRKKARGGAASTGRKGGRRKGATRAAEPTLSDLLRAKEAADAQGGVEGLLRAVETVRAAADRVGGLEKLSRSLEALRQLAGGQGTPDGRGG